MLTHFSLFSGIGGIDLAAEWAGFKTVGQCEYADYPTKVLEKHWPDVPRWRDVRDVTAESVRAAGIRAITLISGGFPCQPFSIAGKRKGKEDDRDLWPEMFRIIQEIKPRWVLGENVANFVNMELERTILDLESEGYETQAFIIPACAVGAPHRRDRVWIVAHAHCERKLQSQRNIQNIREWISNCGKDVADTKSQRLQRMWPNREQELHTHEKPRLFSRGSEIGERWAVEPDVGRVAHGIPNRVDRLKALGNAVVPQQVYPLLKAISEIETIA